jgi:hypothetical protein
MKDVIRSNDLDALHKMKARRKYRYALRTGKLVRGVQCAECASREGIHGHHEDLIEKPLVVIWLCRACHKKRNTSVQGDDSLVLAVRIEREWYFALKHLTDSQNSMSDLAREALKRFLRSQGKSLSE